MDKSKTVNYLPVCRICDAPASGFHYGVYTCEACKAFFRRSLSRHSVYLCADEESCLVSFQNRNLCAFCRYKKCLKMGMCKEAIKTGRYTHETRALNIRAMREQISQQTDQSVINSSESIDKSISDPSITDQTSDQSDTSQSINEGSIKNQSVENSPDLSSSNDSWVNFEIFNDNKEDTFNVDILFEKLEMDQDVTSHYKTLFDSTRTEFYESIIGVLVDKFRDYYMKNGQECHPLSEQDIDYLEMLQLKKQIFGTMKPMSMDEYITFYRATGIDIDGRRELLESSVLPRIEQGILQMLAISKTIPGFNDLCVFDQTNLIKAARFDIFLLGRHRCFDIAQNIYFPLPGVMLHKDDWMKVRGEAVESILKVVERIQRLNLCDEEICVLCALAVMFTDNCHVENRTLVEQSQNVLLECLFYVLDKYHPADRTRFTQIINCLTQLRTVRQESFECEAQLAQNWRDIINFPPLLYNIFLTASST